MCIITFFEFQKKKLFMPQRENRTVADIQTTKDSDHPTHPHSPISTFFVTTGKL